MDTAKLSKMCRCGHARRFHAHGGLLTGGGTECYFQGHPEARDYPDYCYYFEAVEGWQESYVDALRAEGYIVERIRRDERGRFAAFRREA